MTRLKEGSLAFEFDSRAEATKYDEWTFYRTHFDGVVGETKAVDFLCLIGDVLWIIEVKDYRHDRRTKPSDLADEVAHKVRDTLAGLAAASHYANVPTERDFAIRALCQTTSLKVVLHLEQPTNPSRLHPKLADPANVQMKLKKRLHQAIDDHPKVLDRTLTQSHDYCWTVSSVPVA